MLAHHGRIECAPEFEFLVEHMPARSGFPELEAYYEWLATNRIFVPHGFTIDRALDYPALMRSFLAQYCARLAEADPRRHVPQHFDRPSARGRARASAPPARRPRRRAPVHRHGWAANVWHGAERRIRAGSQDRARTRGPAGAPHGAVYEDLIREPARELARVCRFLGTDFDQGMLEYHRDSSYERPDPALIGQWRKKLTPEELGLLEARIGPLLRSRGYEESGVPALDVGPLRRLALTLEDRLRRLRFRRQRYGLRLLLKSRLANLLGLPSWKRAVLLEQNEIDNRHLQ